MPQSAIDASKALNVTLTGDKVKDDDIIMNALGRASDAEKAAFYTVRYGSAWTNTFGPGGPFAPIKEVITSGSGAGATRVTLDDPSVAYARSYWDGINAARKKASDEFDELMATVFQGRPTFDSSLSSSAFTGPNRAIAPRDANVDRSPTSGGGSRLPDVDENGDDDFSGRDPNTGFRKLQPQDRTLDDYGASVPPTRRVSTTISAPIVTTGGGGSGGGSGGSGSGSGGSGSGGGSNGDGSGTGGGSGSGTGTGTDQNTIDRLIDLVSGQYNSGGGGVGSGGGVVGLPTDVVTTGGGSSGKGIATLFLVAGAALIGWFAWKKYKGE